MVTIYKYHGTTQINHIPKNTGSSENNSRIIISIDQGYLSMLWLLQTRNILIYIFQYVIFQAQQHWGDEIWGQIGKFGEWIE